MGSINRVTLMGSLGSAPERRQTAQGKSYVRLSLATQRRNRHPQTGAITSQTQWHAVNVWGKDAELCLQYLSKGSPVCVEGHLSPYKREVNGPGSELRTHVAIVADRIQLIPGTRAAQMAEPTHLLEDSESENDLAQPVDHEDLEAAGRAVPSITSTQAWPN
jgi:single stranded DNA-binding protein